MNSVAQFWIGQVLLWIGFLTAALATVSWMNPAAAAAGSEGELSRLEWSPWATIPWGIYVSGISVGVVGCILIHIAKRQRVLERRQGNNDLDVLRQQLAELVEHLKELSGRVSDLPPESVLDYIDAKCQPLFNEFADRRMTIADHYGLAAFAQVMSEFASAERFINRAWSAAADGYVDEVAACCSRASRHIEMAEALLAGFDQR